MVARLDSVAAVAAAASGMGLCSEISGFAGLCGCEFCFCYHFCCRFVVWFLMGLQWVVKDSCGCVGDFGFSFFFFLVGCGLYNGSCSGGWLL